MNTPGYESLAGVLRRAYDQAASGKGAQRHANDLPFNAQPMQAISELLHSDAGLLYQAMKKIQESVRMDKDAKIRELLGAINYIAGSIIFEEAQAPAPVKANSRPTHWICSCGHPDVKVLVGEACPSCFSLK